MNDITRTSKEQVHERQPPAVTGEAIDAARAALKVDTNVTYPSHVAARQVRHVIRELITAYERLHILYTATCGTYCREHERATAEPSCEPDQPEVIQLVAVKNGRACVVGIPAYYSKLPEDHPWQHNCDANGCTTVEHILWRGPVQDESTSQPPAVTPAAVHAMCVYIRDKACSGCEGKIGTPYGAGTPGCFAIAREHIETALRVTSTKEGG